MAQRRASCKIWALLHRQKKRGGAMGMSMRAMVQDCVASCLVLCKAGQVLLLQLPRG